MRFASTLGNLRRGGVMVQDSSFLDSHIQQIPLQYRNDNSQPMFQLIDGVNKLFQEELQQIQNTQEISQQNSQNKEPKVREIQKPSNNQQSESDYSKTKLPDVNKEIKNTHKEDSSKKDVAVESKEKKIQQSEDGSEQSAIGPSVQKAIEEEKKSSEIQSEEGIVSEEINVSQEDLFSIEESSSEKLALVATRTQANSDKKSVSVQETQKSLNMLDAKKSLDPLALENNKSEYQEQGNSSKQSSQEKAQESEYSVVKDELSQQISGVKNLNSSSQEATKILQALNDLAQKTSVKVPNGTKLSNNIIEGVKASGGRLAQQIDVPKQIVTAQKSGKSSLDKPQTTDPKATLEERIDKIQKMKAKVIEQVKFHLKLIKRGHMKEIQMRLHPEILGKIKVKLTQEDASKLVASFIVENETVKEILQKNLNQLQESLQEKGIEVDSLDVNVEDKENQKSSSNGFSSLEEQQDAREWVQSFKLSKQQDQTEDEVDSSSTSAQEKSDPDQLLDVLA
jgi:flagellar hook-length control protein FliK